jgi:ferritin
MHAEICGIPKERIWKVFEHDLSQFLYDDIELLNELDHELVIVTRGHEKFQKLKAEASGITEKVKEVIVVQERSKDSADIDLLVDDSEEEVERVEIPSIKVERPEEGLEKVLEKVNELEA